LCQTKGIAQPRHNFERYLSHHTKTNGFHIQPWLLFYIPVLLFVFQEFSHTPNTFTHYLIRSLLKISARARLPRCRIFLSLQSTQTCNAFLGRHTCTHAHVACGDRRPWLPCHKVWVRVSHEARRSHPCLLVTFHFAIGTCKAQPKIWAKPQAVTP